ncbi:hypothetical protein Vadar_033698 [Vaccinium darrowii]|uniref:Uncharacterized protein n=1 Tax=Vaccinium darrowii TaxID=229202 RepID=A0ACB7X675_9ERIC|nr:hypothetical protein Vadar_033698 [Vaccinium darrowii]
MGHTATSPVKWAANARHHWNATKRRRFTTKRRCKYNSLLHQYIMSLTSPDQSSELRQLIYHMEAANCEPDHNCKAVNCSSQLGQSSFECQVFDKMPEYCISCRECLKNHTVGLGGYAVNGCGEFFLA